VLDVLFCVLKASPIAWRSFMEGLGISKLQFLIKRKEKISAVFFSIFGQLSISFRIRTHLKYCIHNTDLCMSRSTCFLINHNAIALDYILIRVSFSSFIITNHHIPPLGNSTRCGRYYLYHTGEENVGLPGLISLCCFLSYDMDG
jgi:hypothetical protein